MGGLFVDSSAWDKTRVSKWAISSGPSAGLGAVLFGEASVINFHNLQVNQKKSLFLVSAGVGAKLEASFKAASAVEALSMKNQKIHVLESKMAEKALELGGDLKKASQATGGNPLSMNLPTKVTVHNAFCLQDLQFATAFKGSVGADPGIFTFGFSGVTFYSRTMTRLFSMSGATAEVAIGAGLNMGSVQGGKLIDVCPTALPKSVQMENRRERERLMRNSPVPFYSNGKM